MKKILFLLLFFAASCAKNEDVQTADEYENVSDEADLSGEMSEFNGLEDRASTAMRIDSLVQYEEFSEFKKVNPNTYLKFGGYWILHQSNDNNEGIFIKIKGANFGQSGTVNCFITSKLHSRCTVLSYDSTEIKVKVDSLKAYKNVVLKLAVTANGKTKTKTQKCVGSNMTVGGTGTGTQRTYIHYPLSMWEVNYQMQLFNKQLQGTEGSINASYIPRVGDVLRRTIAGKVPKNWEYQFGFVVGVGAPDRNGNFKVKVKERNRLGTGRIETISFLYKNGVFTFKDIPNYNDFIR
jgi:hypothetical protein